MDFSWTDEQLALKEKTIKFAQEELNNDISEREQQNHFSVEDWKKCAEYGILGLCIPREYGGQGHTPLTTILMMEALGYGCLDNGLPFGLNSQMWSLQPAILKFGSEAQKQKYLPGLCQGEIMGAFGITEPETGSDSYAMQSTATKTDGGYILNGQKSYVTLAPVADIAVFFATTDPELGRWGITAFVVERSAKGFTTSPVRDKMGMRTIPMGDLYFEDCFIPEENRLGPEGAGVSLFTTAMESERGYIFASQLGAMQRQLEDAIRYARKRKAFGQSIGKFQSVSNRVADMRLRLELAQMLLYKVAWLEEQGKPLLMEAAMAKLYLSEMFVESSLDSIRLHGAKGYVTEYEIERDLRDGVGGLISSGEEEEE
ncbi:MAG: acyl-CoA dehydrogenase family protein, partial [Chloroflexota bacterium]